MMLEPAVKTIIAAVAQAAGTTPAEITGPSRSASAVILRHRAMWITKQLRPDLSLKQIAMAFGRTDHTTTIHAVRHYERVMAGAPYLRTHTRALLRSLKPEPAAPPRLTLKHRVVAWIVRTAGVSPAMLEEAWMRRAS